MCKISRTFAATAIIVLCGLSGAAQAGLFDKLKDKAVDSVKDETTRNLEWEVERKARELVPSFESVETSAQDSSEPVIPPAGVVVIYTTQSCGYCRRAMKYLQENNVPHRQYDVQHDPKGEADYQALRGRGVPIILAGDQRMDGFSESSMDSFLQRAGIEGR